MMDTLTMLQKQQWEQVQRIKEVNRAKAARHVKRRAEEDQWSQDELELVLGALGVGDEGANPLGDHPRLRGPALP